MGHGPKGADRGGARPDGHVWKLVNYSTKALLANILDNVVVETVTIVKCLKSLSRHMFYTKRTLLNALDDV